MNMNSKVCLISEIANESQREWVAYDIDATQCTDRLQSAATRLNAGVCKYYRIHKDKTAHARLDVEYPISVGSGCQLCNISFTWKDIAEMSFAFLIRLTMMWPLLFLEKPQASSQFELCHNTLWFRHYLICRQQFVFLFLCNCQSDWMKTE